MGVVRLGMVERVGVGVVGREGWVGLVRRVGVDVVGRV